MFATSLERWLYRHIAKPFFFRRDPEAVHDRICMIGSFLGRFAVIRAVTRLLFAYHNPMLEQTILGIHFPNPVGLTAGFDKNAELTDMIPHVGFGFEEVGSITGEPCNGNPKPRLWRLPESKALLVWYGLKNDGCEAIAKRLQSKNFIAPIGTSIARTNNASTIEDATGIADYAKAFRACATIGDYTTVNISCPNTCGGEPFTTPERLDALLNVIDKIPTTKPTFIKIPCDISPHDLDALIAVALHHRVHGVIVSNLTKRHDRPEIVPHEIAGKTHGGVSGKPTFRASNELISHLYHTVGSRLIIIGSGGIFSAEDAYEKIKRGASLVQLATGMIFEGPQLIGEINRGLVAYVKKDGYQNISEAIGVYSR
jgi:dihydroorotate dehydrogenase subfamily 2